MELYHVTTGNPFNEVDLKSYGNDKSDFGLKLYFHFTWDDAVSFQEYLQEYNTSVCSLTVPDNLLYASTYKQFTIYNAGFCGINPEGVREFMSRQQQLEFMRIIVSYRMPHIVPSYYIKADIMLGSRADVRVVRVLENNILSLDDYKNDAKMLEVFELLETMNLGPQIAFGQEAIDYFSDNGRLLKWL